MNKIYSIEKDEMVEATQEDFDSLQKLHRTMALHYREHDLKSYEKFWQEYKAN